MKKINLFFIAILFLVLSLLEASEALASKSIVGWLWGGSNDGGIAQPGQPIDTGIGWVSMNSANTTSDEGGGAISYGVTIPDENGLLSGYAWSSNVGWINFGGVSRVGNSLSGNAVIVGINGSNSGGWNGNIDVSGVSLNEDVFTGYGWHGDGEIIDGQYYGFGWVDFSRARIACVPDYKYDACLIVSNCEDACAESCGKTVTLESTCLRTDRNGCPDSSLPTPKDCEDNGISCPSTQTCVCDPCLNVGSWKEVAP